MKKMLVSLLTVVAVMVFAMGSAIGADKLIVKDSGGTNSAFAVTDAGDVTANGRITLGRGTAPVALSSVSKAEFGNDGFTEVYISSSQDPGTGMGGNPSLVMYRSRGTSATPTVVSANDWLGSFFARGYDGSAYKNASGVRFAADGTIGANSMPGRITFHTSAAGTTSFAERMRITSAGYVGIGTTAPASALHVNGTISYTGLANVSSRAYKDNIENISAQEAMKMVADLTPVSFTYLSDPDTKHMGFIAEDVPAQVATKDRKGVMVTEIIAVLTKVVKEQSRTIEALSAKVDMLEKASK